MKVFWVLLYNGFIYPLIFVVALVISIFDEKLKKSILGRFKSISLLKQYFKEFNEPPLLYWFHAASLGEFHQVKPVIDGLKEERDDIKIIVSFSSPSGYENSLNESIDLKKHDYIFVFETAHNEETPEILYDFVTTRINITLDARTMKSRKQQQLMENEIRRCVHLVRNGDGVNHDRMVYKTRTDLSDRTKFLFRTTFQVEVVIFAELIP